MLLKSCFMRRKTLAQEMIGKKRFFSVTRDMEEKLNRASKAVNRRAVAERTFDDLTRQLAAARKSVADSVCVAQDEKPAEEIERRAERNLCCLRVKQLTQIS